MSDMYQVSSSPHARDKISTSKIMLYVVIALLPACLFGIYNFGIRALIVVLATVASCVLSEYVFNKIVKKPQTINDLSAVVTGMILAMNMPVNIPIWMPVMGGVFAMVIVKGLFGGLGQNFMNPALGARCFLLIAFASSMTNFNCDAYTGATPLALMRAGGVAGLQADGQSSYKVMDLFLGTTAGTIGETCVIALLIGAIFMIVMDVIDLKIPAAYIITFAVFMLIFGKESMSITYVAAQICGGGLIFGAFFMATDYVTSPITPNGKILFGICCGILTGLFRCFGANAEGVSFAIILSNIFVPFLEQVTVPLAFGLEKPKKEAK